MHQPGVLHQVMSCREYDDEDLDLFFRSFATRLRKVHNGDLELFDEGEADLKILNNWVEETRYRASATPL
ncbi:unnamed protein product, partial [Mesorhabditis spiculigera]